MGSYCHVCIMSSYHLTCNYKQSGKVVMLNLSKRYRLKHITNASLTLRHVSVPGLGMLKADSQFSLALKHTHSIHTIHTQTSLTHDDNVTGNNSKKKSCFNCVLMTSMKKQDSMCNCFTGAVSVMLK